MHVSDPHVRIYIYIYICVNITINIGEQTKCQYLYSYLGIYAIEDDHNLNISLIDYLSSCSFPFTIKSYFIRFVIHEINFIVK